MKRLSDIWENLRQRRKSLGFVQKDMRMKIGMDQRQYQRLESGADTKVSTLLRILEGLDAEIVLVPKERLSAVDQLLEATPEQFHALENAMMDVESASGISRVSDAPLLWDKVLRKDTDKGGA